MVAGTSAISFASAGVGAQASPSLCEALTELAAYACCLSSGPVMRRLHQIHCAQLRHVCLHARLQVHGQ